MTSRNHGKSPWTREQRRCQQYLFYWGQVEYRRFYNSEESKHFTHWDQLGKYVQLGDSRVQNEGIAKDEFLCADYSSATSQLIKWPSSWYDFSFCDVCWLRADSSEYSSSENIGFDCGKYIIDQTSRQYCREFDDYSVGNSKLLIASVVLNTWFAISFLLQWVNFLLFGLRNVAVLVLGLQLW